MYYMLYYEVAEDYINKRAPFREEHLKLAREAHERGELVLGGALADPLDFAILVFKADDRSVVERFAMNDPYVKEGAVKEWRIRQWDVAIGGD